MLYSIMVISETISDLLDSLGLDPIQKKLLARFCIKSHGSKTANFPKEAIIKGSVESAHLKYAEIAFDSLVRMGFIEHYGGGRNTYRLSKQGRDICNELLTERKKI